MQKKLIIAIFFLLAGSFPPQASGAKIVLDDFRDGLDPGWQEKSFVGKTTYEVVNDGRKSFVRARSSAAASGLYYKINFDPAEHPIITWSWKVENVLARGDAHRKTGDDYAARLYVVFPSIFFWKTKVLNYIWANKLPKGDAVPNPFTSNAIMIAVQSGPAETGKWLTEKRDIQADYLRYFGSKPGKVGAIAIMTDTDNTGEEAVAYYGPISIITADHEE